MSVSLSSSSLTTVTPGTFVRLRPDDQIVVNVGVQNTAGIAAGTSSTATVTITDANGTSIAVARASEPWSVTAGIPDWQNTDPSLTTHESPEWVSIYAHSQTLQALISEFSITTLSLAYS